MGKDNQVAIVGFSFRLPGARKEDLWEELLNGTDLVSEVEPWRWAQEAFFHPRKSEPGKAYTFAAGSVSDVAGFDAGFFNISPREAEQLDPQQRFLLEMSWEAMEDAGIRPSSLKGSQCAVYIGFSSTDYAYRRFDDLASIDSTMMTGNTASIAANRLSYFFDLRGPSMAVDTACSSSMVAFHQACLSIQSGESSQALVGGISLHLHPFGFVGFSKASMLSERGICNVFDASGDGYVRSEGGGIFLLKNLDDAIADGSRIYAVVQGSGVNCDGKTNGITVPGYETQSELLKTIYASTGISINDIDYFEAHGTGTAVGDPIEARAIGQALGQYRSPDKPLLIGSVKSNLGHLEAASAVAGLVKALYVIRHGVVPPTIHLKEPNPHIHFKEWNLKVVTEATQLQTHKDLVVGVNSFGFGGANAHVVLRAYGQLDEQDSSPVNQANPPLRLSAKTDSALRDLAAAYASYLQHNTGQNLYDVAYHAWHHRETLAQTVIFPCNNHQQLIAELHDFAQQGSGVQQELLEQASAPVFVYSGNGSQWIGMGAQLMLESELFREVVERVDTLYQQYADFSIIEKLTASDQDSDPFELTEVAQPALFAVQVGITELLRNKGCQPAAVVGHSVGEVAAAWACGALTLEQAVEVIFIRSSEQGKTRGTGGMTAVGLDAKETSSLLNSLGLEKVLVVAGINSHRGVTVAGGVKDLSRFEAVLADREIFHRRLGLDYAFHSDAMEPIKTGILDGLDHLQPQQSQCDYYSTVTGAKLSGEMLDAGYWWKNVRDPVNFESAVCALMEDKFNVFIEIGPHAILRNYLNDCLRKHSVAGKVIVTLLRDKDDESQVNRAFLQALAVGAEVDMARVFPVKGKFVDLPTYAWQHEKYWHPVTPESYDFLYRSKSHPLLGYRLSEESWAWENQLDIVSLPVYADHVVGNAVVFPAAGFIEMALAASMQWLGGEYHQLEEFEIRLPLLLDNDASRTVRLKINEADGSFTIKSRPRLSDEPWVINVLGKLLTNQNISAVSLPSALPAEDAHYDSEAHYQLTQKVGLSYGNAFQAVSRVWVEKNQVLAELKMPVMIEAGIHESALHPSFLDGCFQLLVDLLRNDAAINTGVAFVPVQVSALTLYKPASVAVLTRGELVKRSPRSVVMDFELFDQQGEVVALVKEVRFRAVQLKQGVKAHTSYLSQKLVPMPLHKSSATAELSGLKSDSASRNRTDQDVIEQYHREVGPLLDILCGAFAERALREITQGKLFSPSQLVSDGVVLPRHAFLLGYLVEMLLEDGFLEPVEQGIRWVSDSDMPVPEVIWNSILGDYPDFATECLLIGRVGSGLAGVLQGKVDSQDLLSGACGGAVYSHYMGSSLVFDHQNRDIAEKVSLALAGLNNTDRVRVLELSGCGSHLCNHVLPRIDFDHCDYVLCVPSEQALIQYEALLERYPAVITVVLDLSNAARSDLEIFQQHFDLAIINHELAASTNAELYLENLWQIMLPQGQLLVSESFSDRWTDIVFGLEDNWWLQQSGSHLQSRLHSPQFWQNLLIKKGFSVSLLHQQDELHSGVYLLTAQADKPATKDLSGKQDAQTWIVFHDKEGYSSELAATVSAYLKDKQYRVIPVISTDSDEPQHNAAYQVNAESATQLKVLLSSIKKQSTAIDGILYLADFPVAQSCGLDNPVKRCHSLTSLINACEKLALSPELLLVTWQAQSGLLAQAGKMKPDHDPLDAATWGFGRALSNEYPDMSVRLIDLAEMDQLERMATALAQEVLSGDSEDEVVLSSEGRFVTRIASIEDLSGKQMIDPGHKTHLARLEFSMPGPLKHLGWYLHSAVEEISAGEVEIEVRAAGLNFRDVMYAMGLLSDEAVENGFAGPTLGMELSGIISKTGCDVDEFKVGDEVIAFAPSSFATRAVTNATAVVHKPSDWSFEAAATVPTTFFTVYYALHQLAHLQPGEKILIHGAAGGVGIAAIQYARYLGAEIFATAGSDEKRNFVRLLGADHVFDSRSLAFADEILKVTNNQGVDVVLNSLAGEAINRNLKVLKPFGRFLELGKRDFYENTKIGLRPFRNNISYFGIDADQMISVYPDMTQRLFHEVMELLKSGELKPLPYRSFSSAEVIDAFRYMQQSKQVGKIIISFDDPVKCQPGYARQQNKLELSPEATYMVTGGLGGFGLKTAQWLAEKGARHLILLGRSGAATDEARRALEQLEKAGVSVNAVKCDVTDRQSLTDVFKNAALSMPPVRGVIHAAMVISDGLIRNMSRQQLHQVLSPKIQGAHLLDELSTQLELDFFVMYSSITTLFGNPGQANYVAANRYLEALAEARRARGLPGLAVCWGAIDDVGYLARNEEIKQSLQSRMGSSALNSDHALEVLEQLILNDRNAIGVVDLDWHAISRYLASADSPKFIELARQSGEKDESESLEDIQQLLNELPHKELVSIFIEMMKKEVSEILRIPVEKLDENESVYEMGMDSLMAMELASAVDERFGISLPLMSLSEGPTIAKLVERIIELLHKPQQETTGDDNDLKAQIQQVAAQHGELDDTMVEEIQDTMQSSEQVRRNTSLLH